MVPAPLTYRSRTPGLVYTVAHLAVQNVPKLARSLFAGGDASLDGATADVTMHTFAKREEKHDAKFIVCAILIPVLVLLGGLFAGLTLGYMSLDETQLHVLSISGTPQQKAYAKKIEPIRKNGHLLLVTLLLANMIVNETLPVISTPVLGGGAQSVVVSTVLIVIFSEIIPQALCTRYGLAIGASMVWLVRILIYVLGIASWPAAKILEFTLGSHHGIMYRRAELKELIAMHSTTGELGGDLKHDTVTIIGATLDLQEKVVRQAMTPIEKVFMLNYESTLDYDTLKRIADTGHSRVPVYEEIEVPVVSNELVMQSGASTPVEKKDAPLVMQKVKKIVGILLVKQCLMLDPRDATPLRKLALNRVINVPNNMSLLAILDRFQEGRSHMAIVSRFSEEKAASVKHVVKKGLTQRLMARVGMGDSSSGSDTDSDSDSESESDAPEGSNSSVKKSWRKSFRHKRKSQSQPEPDLEKAEGETSDHTKEEEHHHDEEKKELSLPQSVWAKMLTPGREQNMPDDAVLTKEDAKGFLKSFDPSVAPVGIITLEDVLEELIGEEIYDEFDPEGQSHLKTYISPRSRPAGRRAPDSKMSPEAPSEGTTAACVSFEDSKPMAQSMPASPVIVSASPDDAPVSRASSLGQSLSAFAGYRRQLREKGGSASGASTPRERSRVRGLSSGVSTGATGVTATATPATGAERVANIQEEEGARIPDAQEKSGPDIEGPEEKEKEKAGEE